MRRFWLGSLVLCGCLSGTPLWAQGQQKSAQNSLALSSATAGKDPVERAAFEHALDEEQLKALQGQTVKLLMRNGDEEENVVIKKFVTGKQADRFRSIDVLLNGKTSRKINAEKVFQIEAESVVYPLSYLPTQKMYVLDDLAARTEAINEQLAKTRYRHEFWGELSQDEIDKETAKQKDALEKVKQHFTRLSMQIHETRYFLFCTDMPAGQAAPFITQLDKMYEFLGQAFGIKPGTNVWKGKCPVVCFTNRGDFYEYESKFMENPNAVGAQGICHSSTSGAVTISCYRGENPDFFAAVLVHETAHGYIHRVKTSTFVTTWVNEGIAEWVAAAIVPKEGKAGEIGRRQRAGAEVVTNAGRLGPFYELEGLSREQYGIASSMVELLLKINPEQFKLFFNGIKEGLEWEDSLTRAYGMNRADLTRLYGRTLGLPNLTE